MAFRVKAVLLAAGVSVMASPMLSAPAAAQQGGYDQRYGDPQGDQRYYDDRGYDTRYYDESYDQQPPPGYDGTRPPPPPRGWQDNGDYAVNYAADDRFAQDAELWAQANCVRSGNNAGVGAVVGGIVGALIGNGVSGRRDRVGGTLAGAAIGAAGGAVVGGATSNATSPGCPPGYVLRGGAAPFQYGAYYGDVGYVAPAWYRPWVFTSGRWLYRPYPYHRFYGRYYRPYRWGRPGPRRRWRRRW